MFTLICPHCHHPNNKDADDLPWINAQMAYHECINCDKVFVAVAYERIEHETAKSEGEL